MSCSEISKRFLSMSTLTYSHVRLEWVSTSWQDIFVLMTYCSISPIAVSIFNTTKIDEYSTVSYWYVHQRTFCPSYIVRTTRVPQSTGRKVKADNVTCGKCRTGPSRGRSFVHPPTIVEPEARILYLCTCSKGHPLQAFIEFRIIGLVPLVEDCVVCPNAKIGGTAPWCKFPAELVEALICLISPQVPA